MNDSFDVVIAGAGIVGAACALELARGGVSVAVADPAFAGAGATAAGMGHLVVMQDSEPQFRLTAWSRQLWHELAPELPAEAEYSQCGTLWVAAGEDELAAARRLREAAAARGLAAELLDAAGLAEAEPQLRPGLAGGLLIPQDAVVYAPIVARWMIRRAVAMGAVFRPGVAVESMRGGRAKLSDWTVWSAGALVNAAGAGAARLTRGLPIQPRKGHLAITDRAPGFLRHQVVELGYTKSVEALTPDSVAFNLSPRPTGQVLIGSSRQSGVETAEVDRPILEAMLRRAFSFMPALRELSAIRCWTGLRAATPDQLPLIGPHPELAGVWIATGHEGLGITMALGTARLLAAQLTGRVPEIPAEPYLPSRQIVMGCELDHE
jgi:glycine/D-amino acid oxidase-like deaminating enzyme